MNAVKVTTNNNLISYNQQSSSNQASTTRPSIGINPIALNDWSPERPFLDLFKSSRPWLWEVTGYPRITTNIDRQGWLTSVRKENSSSTILSKIIKRTSAKSNKDNDTNNILATSVLFTHRKDQALNGEYVVFYDGTGTIQYRHTATQNQALSKPGKDVITINVQPGGAHEAWFSILDTGSERNHIRNIRIIPKQYENTYTNFYSKDTFNPSTAQIFNPDFLRQFQGLTTVRFMDWMQTNGTTVVNWSDAPKLGDAHWNIGKGVPVEVMVALSNQARVDPWFTMPHMGTIDYVRKFAQYVKNNIAPDRKIYVEYTNEAWNTIFPQTQWIIARATQAGMYYIDWYLERSLEIIKTWKDVFGAESDRIVGVIGGQSGNTWLGGQIMNYLERTNNLSNVDAFAIAPYFGYYATVPEYESQLEKMTVDDMFDEITKGGVLKPIPNSYVPRAPRGALQQSLDFMQDHADLLQQTARRTNTKPLQLLASEAGQHLVPLGPLRNNKKVVKLFNDVVNDPRMADVYRQYFEGWKKISDGPILYYDVNGSPSTWFNQVVNNFTPTNSATSTNSLM